MRSGKEWNENSLVATWRHGVKGVRKLDWGDDIVTTGDVYRVKEIRLHCPDGRVAVLEISPELGQEPFQFKTNSLDLFSSAGGVGLEYMVIGRLMDKLTGAAECFIWDYKPLTALEYKPAVYDASGVLLEPEQLARAAQPNLIAYRTNINNFGGWRDTVTPMGKLSEEVQGFRL
jgi:hypothetical protein